MRPQPPPNYLAGYPAALVEPVRQAIADGRLAERLRLKYPRAHAVRTDRALYAYVGELKGTHLRNAGPLNKVVFDGNLQAIGRALGTHTRIARVQGARLMVKREIRVANVFKAMPPEFLRMIVVHELAHLKERDHDKAFYQLCTNMEPDYHRFEFDLRAYLCYLAAAGAPLWSDDAAGAVTPPGE